MAGPRNTVKTHADSVFLADDDPRRNPVIAREIKPAKAAAPPREKLSDFARQMMDDLPPSMSLEQTGRLFPHVANRIALVWNNAKDLDDLLKNLLLLDRPNREGFPLSVLSEISDIREQRLALLDPARRHRL